jgi:hypothetical protein
MRRRLLLIPVLILSLFAIGALAAEPATKRASTRRGGTTRAVQQFAQSEKDPASPRKSRLKSKNPDNEVVRLDVDNDGDPDIIEHWWNSKRARWLDENDDMRTNDARGDQTMDAVQIDRNGDGYYDGPEDINIKWADDDRDGRPDLQLFAANPTADATSVRSGTAHWMIFIDTDHDGVNGYINWEDFEFRQANWRVPPTTSPTITIPPPNFSPDYMGNAIFLKDHRAPGSIANPQYNWENPFAFYDEDGDGVSELSIRILESPKESGPKDNPTFTFHGFANEAMGGWDLDNDSQKGNEFDFDMSFRFFSDEDGKKGGRIDYRKYKDKHPSMKAPQWVIDGKYFRFDNWRKIDHFVYPTWDKCFDEMWNPKQEFMSCWMVFDEDDDDHRWERVEFQYPSTQPYSTKRMSTTRPRRPSTSTTKGGDNADNGHDNKETAAATTQRTDSSVNRNNGGLGGHVQSDSLGDRGEWDEDNSGQGRIYIGRWDRKFHLYGAEKGAWTVDEHGRYWGSRPVLGNSSPTTAPTVTELVQYADTDKNGFLDEITFDYDGDQKVDLRINLLDYKTAKDPHPDVRETYDPGKLRWKGMSELFAQRANLSFQEALKIYRAAWKKGFTNPEIDDYAFASSIGDRYNQAYWLKEEIFRLIDKRLKDDKGKRDELRRLYFLGDTNGLVTFIDSLDPLPVPPASRPAKK